MVFDVGITDLFYLLLCGKIKNMKMHCLRVVFIFSMIMGIIFSAPVYAGGFWDKVRIFFIGETAGERNSIVMQEAQARFDEHQALLQKERARYAARKKIAELRRSFPVIQPSFFQIRKEYQEKEKRKQQEEQARIKMAAMHYGVSQVVDLREKIAYLDDLLSNPNSILDDNDIIKKLQILRADLTSYMHIYCHNLILPECELFMRMIVQEDKKRHIDYLYELDQREQAARDADRHPNAAVIQRYENARFDLINNAPHLSDEEISSAVAEIDKRLEELYAE